MQHSILRTKEDLTRLSYNDRKARGLAPRGLRNQWGKQHKVLMNAMDVNAQVSAWWIRQVKNPIKDGRHVNKTRKKKRLILKVKANAV